MDQKYTVAVELRGPHNIAHKTLRRAEEKFETMDDAITIYEALLSALRTMEAFSE